MRNHTKVLLAITTNVALLLSPIAYSVTNTPCNSGINKDAVHCAYLASTIQTNTGKYLKIKEVLQGQPSSSLIFCAASCNKPLMSIPQFLWSNYHEGQDISWQFTQCSDEDCTTGKILFDDKFTITKRGNSLSSGPHNTTEVNLDPNYGANCIAGNSDMLRSAKQHTSTLGSALQTRLDDATTMVNAIPKAMIETISILQQMNAIAYEGATGTYSSMQLSNLDKAFQLYKNEMNKAQQFISLDGIKNLSGGDLVIQIGNDNLTIPIPQTNYKALGLVNTNVLTVQSSTEAIEALTTAITNLVSGLS